MVFSYVVVSWSLPCQEGVRQRCGEYGLRDKLSTNLVEATTTIASAVVAMAGFPVTERRSWVSTVALKVETCPDGKPCKL